mmetsp:Transcript_18401/g.43998  ORF Transcript_18401/g.43998 Transcript_18401/m.43998 type:complete len:220 (+) Transcript_18401:65-724(+)
MMTGVRANCSAKLEPLIWAVRPLKYTSPARSPRSFSARRSSHPCIFMASAPEMTSPVSLTRSSATSVLAERRRWMCLERYDCSGTTARSAAAPAMEGMGPSSKERSRTIASSSSGPAHRKGHITSASSKRAASLLTRFTTFPVEKPETELLLRRRTLLCMAIVTWVRMCSPRRIPTQKSWWWTSACTRLTAARAATKPHPCDKLVSSSVFCCASDSHCR